MDTLARMRRALENDKATIASAMRANEGAQNERSSERVMPAKPSPVTQRPAEPAIPGTSESEKNFAVALAAHGALFGTGLLQLAAHDWWFGGVYTVGGALGLMSVTPLIRARFEVLRSPRSLWTAITVTWLFLAANIGFSSYAWWTAPPSISSAAHTPPAAPAPLEPTSLNPLQGVSAKWVLSQNLSKSPFKSNCNLVVVRYPSVYADRLAENLKEVLDAVGWKYREMLASSPLPRALSLRSLENGPSRPCANVLFEKFNGSGLRYSSPEVSGNLPVSLNWIPENAIPQYIKDCPEPCVEIGVGNEPWPP
jgi:hypothetical protein